MIDYPRENHFLIPILEKSQIFVQLSVHYRKQKQVAFFLKKLNNHQPLANNPPKSNTCSTYLSLISSYIVIELIKINMQVIQSTSKTYFIINCKKLTWNHPNFIPKKNCSKDHFKSHMPVHNLLSYSTQNHISTNP